MRNLFTFALPALLLAVVLIGKSHATDSSAATRQSVVLLHGLARSASSMSRMAAALEEAGYHVCNIAYPSREYPVETLAADYVAPAIKQCIADPSQPVSFVTHSLGGIVVRQLSVSESGITIDRVVMLSPPNQGSEVVDKLGDLRLFALLNGPAGRQLGTKAESLPRSLGPAHFAVGIITGNCSINLFLSLLIPGPDDGKVSIENAKLEGMADFLVVPASHPFIMNNPQVIAQTIHFLKYGSFLHETHLLSQGHRS